jgi:hypothetical protein
MAGNPFTLFLSEAYSVPYSEPASCGGRGWLIVVIGLEIALGVCDWAHGERRHGFGGRANECFAIRAIRARNVCDQKIDLRPAAVERTTTG